MKWPHAYMWENSNETGSHKPEGKQNEPDVTSGSFNCALRSLSLLGRQKNLVDHVDDAVLGRDVGDNDGGVADHDLAVRHHHD